MVTRCTDGEDVVVFSAARVRVRQPQGYRVGEWAPRRTAAVVRRASVSGMRKAGGCSGGGPESVHAGGKSGGVSDEAGARACEESRLTQNVQRRRTARGCR